MDIINVLKAFVSLGAMGAFFGIGLAIASKFLFIKRDERVEAVENVLPGSNCGACGFAGCGAYAEAIALHKEELTLCSPGGGEVAKAVAGIMGVAIEVSMDKNVAQVHCKGGKNIAKYIFSYKGLEDCNGAYILFGGAKQCKYGCLGLGSCIKVCPVDAIYCGNDGLVFVDKELCISCGKCIDVCPSGTMKFIPHSADYIVACNSTDKGAVVRKYCTAGCIGCKICENKSPEGGFIVEDFLARIDYNATGARNEAAEKCPPKCIFSLNTVDAADDIKENKEKETEKV